MRVLHADPDNWPSVLASAKPGDVVKLAPGTYPYIEAPAGVTIRGSYRKNRAPAHIDGLVSSPQPNGDTTCP